MYEEYNNNLNWKRANYEWMQVSDAQRMLKYVEYRTYEDAKLRAGQSCKMWDVERQS